MAKGETKLEAFYPGDSEAARVVFPLESWIDFQKQLVTAEVVMRCLASRHHLVFLSNIYGDWPARRLRKRKTSGYLEVTLQLNPNYMEDQQVFYLLAKRKVRKVLGMFEQLRGYEEIRRCSPSEIDNPEFIHTVLESALCLSLRKNSG